MLDRIEMDVIHMFVEVPVIPNSVLPKSPLPDGCFVPFLPGFAADFSRTDLFQVSFGEKAFDFFPTHRIISITFRQAPDTM